MCSDVQFYQAIRMLPCWFSKVVRRLVQLHIPCIVGWNTYMWQLEHIFLLASRDRGEDNGLTDAPTKFGVGSFAPFFVTTSHILERTFQNSSQLPNNFWTRGGRDHGKSWRKCRQGKMKGLFEICIYLLIDKMLAL